MTQMQTPRPVVEVQPRANVYTALIWVAIVALLVTVGFVMYNLMVRYGLSLGQVFKGGPFAG